MFYEWIFQKVLATYIVLYNCEDFGLYKEFPFTYTLKIDLTKRVFKVEKKGKCKNIPSSICWRKKLTIMYLRLPIKAMSSTNSILMLNNKKIGIKNTWIHWMEFLRIWLHKKVCFLSRVLLVRKSTRLGKFFVMFICFI